MFQFKPNVTETNLRWNDLGDCIWVKYVNVVHLLPGCQCLNVIWDAGLFLCQRVIMNEMQGLCDDENVQELYIYDKYILRRAYFFVV